jgi:hypothetical protein
MIRKPQQTPAETFVSACLDSPKPLNPTNRARGTRKSGKLDILEKQDMNRLTNRLFIAFTLVIAASILLVTCDYFLLWKPSQQGKCGGRTLGSPEPARPRLTRFRGEVVGRNLSMVQYRWLRRRFKAAGTSLSVVRILPSTEYQGNLVRHGEEAGDVVIDKSGRFDFGVLVPGEYELSVTYPGEDSVSFEFVIDPAARSTEVLIDASPAYYCNCCGWNFEPR